MVNLALRDAQRLLVVLDVRRSGRTHRHGVQLAAVGQVAQLTQEELRERQNGGGGKRRHRVDDLLKRGEAQLRNEGVAGRVVTQEAIDDASGVRRAALRRALLLDPVDVRGEDTLHLRSMEL